MTGKTLYRAKGWQSEERGHPWPHPGFRAPLPGAPQEMYKETVEEARWHSRGYLPHLEVPGRAQFLTWRLDDSVPVELIGGWQEEIRREFKEESDRTRELYRRLEGYMDEGHGSCILRNPIAAKLVQDTLIVHHGKLYELHEWVVMPNHEHVLLTPAAGITLGKLTHANKSFTASEIHKALGGQGRLWEPEYFDRMVRDEEHRIKIGHYIRRNPVKAGLCLDASHWAYSSANPIALEKLRGV